MTAVSKVQGLKITADQIGVTSGQTFGLAQSSCSGLEVLQVPLVQLTKLVKTS